MAKAKKRSGDYNEYLIESLKDPDEAASYINAALEESDDPVALLIALRHVAEAYSMSKVAKDAHINRVTAYRILSEKGNPRLDRLFALLEALGLKLKVEIDAQKVA